MSYRIVFKSQSQWPGTELENGDLGEVYPTKEAAEKAKLVFEESREGQDEIMNVAIESQGVEGWLEIVEDE